MEAFWGTLKVEMYYLRKFDTFEELKQAIDEYIKFYNTKRLQKKLKGMTTIEYRSHTLAAYFYIIYHVFLTVGISNSNPPFLNKIKL